MDLRTDWIAFAEQLRDMPPAAAREEILHRLSVYEIHRDRKHDIAKSLHFALAYPVKRRRKVVKDHQRIVAKKNIEDTNRRGKKWRILDQYANELIPLAKDGYGAARLARYVWEAHRKKVSKRTTAYWLAAMREKGEI